MTAQIVWVILNSARSANSAVVRKSL